MIKEHICSPTCTINVFVKADCEASGPEEKFDSGMAESEKHYTKELRDQKLPRNFKKELEGRIWESHNTETTAKCRKPSSDIRQMHCKVSHDSTY